MRAADGNAVAADEVIIAAGVAAPQLLQSHGTRLPIVPGKGYGAGYAATPGNRGVYMLRRPLGDREEFVMFTLTHMPGPAVGGGDT